MVTLELEMVSSLSHSLLKRATPATATPVNTILLRVGECTLGPYRCVDRCSSFYALLLAAAALAPRTLREPVHPTTAYHSPYPEEVERELISSATNSFSSSRTHQLKTHDFPFPAPPSPSSVPPSRTRGVVVDAS